MEAATGCSQLLCAGLRGKWEKGNAAALQFLMGSSSREQSTEGDTQAHTAICVQSPALGRALTKIRQKGPAVPPPARPFTRCTTKCSQGQACWEEQEMGAEGSEAFFFFFCKYNSCHSPTSCWWQLHPASLQAPVLPPLCLGLGAQHEPTPSLLLLSQIPNSTSRLGVQGGVQSTVPCPVPLPGSMCRRPALKHTCQASSASPLILQKVKSLPALRLRVMFPLQQCDFLPKIHERWSFVFI